MSLRKSNPDRVTGPVVSRAVIVGVLTLLGALLFDSRWSNEQIGGWADAIIALLPLLGTLGGAVWGALRAKQTVTPVLAGDQPRDLDGNDLAPVSHNPATGYPPTRAATEEERERLPRRRKPPTTNYP